MDLADKSVLYSDFMHCLKRLCSPVFSHLIKLLVLCCLSQASGLAAQDLQLVELLANSDLRCLVAAGQAPLLADKTGAVLSFETEKARLRELFKKKTNQIKSLKRKLAALKKSGAAKKLIKKTAKQLAAARAALAEAQALIEAVAECQSGAIAPEPVCGNTFVEAGESCDDGNTSGGDCCSAGCSFEPAGSSCSGLTSVCTAPGCNGEGQCVQSSLAGICDDGNVCTTNDSCSGGVCSGTPVSPSVPLSCGIGACARTVFVCPDDLSTVCTPGQVSGEVCNSIDDNCDGTVDGAPASASCPALANAATACQSGNCQLTSCNGENYDDDAVKTDGCEFPDDPAAAAVGHTVDTAKFLGSFPCFDNNSVVDVSARLPSDSRTHIPAIPGFDAGNGSAPDFFRVTASGGGLCINDFAGSITTTGGFEAISDCFKLTVTSTTDSFSTTINGNETKLFDTGSGFYNDDTSIIIKVERICGAFIGDSISYSLNFHL